MCILSYAIHFFKFICLMRLLHRKHLLCKLRSEHMHTHASASIELHIHNTQLCTYQCVNIFVNSFMFSPTGYCFPQSLTLPWEELTDSRGTSTENPHGDSVTVALANSATFSLPVYDSCFKISFLFSHLTVLHIMVALYTGTFYKMEMEDAFR